MDYALTFALLLYFNIFYFMFYCTLELCLILLKAYSWSHKYPITIVLNELILLLLMCILEAGRLILGQKHKKEDFDRELASVFRILILTVPSTYLVFYFTAWQTHITKLDVAFGVVMLVIQTAQMLSSFALVGKNFTSNYRMRVQEGKNG